MNEQRRRELVQRLARSFARRYRGLCPLDLEQEAWLVLLSVRHSPAEEAAEEPYLYRAIARHLSSYSLAQISPVSTRTLRHRRELLSTQALELPAELPFSVEPESLFGAREWSHQVVERLDWLSETTEERELTRALLLRDEKPRDLSRSQQKPVAEIYATAQRMRRRVSRDSKMRQLFHALS